MQRRARSLALMACGALVVVWLALAAAGGVGGAGHPGQPHIPRFHLTSGATPAPISTQSGMASVRATPSRVGPLAPPWVGAALRVLVVVAVAAAVAFLVLRIARQVRVDVPQEADGALAPVVDAPPAVDAAALQAATHHSLARLRTDADLGGAITACWRRFEDLAAESGVPRASWQTAEEYVVDVLGHTAAPAEQLRRLADVYRTARYGARAPEEADRQRAIACLEAISEALGDRP